MRKALCFGVGVLACSVLAAASGETASVAGEWDISYSNSDGTHSAVMRLEQNGEKVKGTVRGERLNDGVIDGKITDTRLGFTVRFYESGRLGSPTDCSATLESAAMKGYCREHTQNWTAKRRR